MKNPQVQHITFVSIVIAAKDEGRIVQHCLNSISRLDYPGDRYEVILVDDHSSDNTADIMAQYAKDHAGWKILSPKKGDTFPPGKKPALEKGIAASQGELIFTTDADCVVPPRWLKGMVNYFNDEVGMVLGFSTMVEGNGFRQRFFEFEDLVSAITAAGGTGLGYPPFCVGRNLAYRREAFYQVGGFSKITHVASGDDLLLMQLIRDKTHWKIAYCHNPETFVRTFKRDGLATLIHQKRRRYGKPLHYTIPTFLLASFILIYHLDLITIPFLFPGLILPWISAIIIKWALEFSLFRRGALAFKQPHLTAYFPLMMVLYPFYVILFSLWGSLAKYRWK
ncbi:glycosyltransferase [candidate division KSB1 bacterium]|nr:glycosyltransferase [candidate division KSB1 bacterium]